MASAFALSLHPPTLQTMKLTSLIALFSVSLAGVQAIGSDDHLHYKGNFHAPYKLEPTSQYRCSADYKFIAHVPVP